MDAIILQPIGIAHTPYQNLRAIPRQGGKPAQIEIFEPFQPALEGLHLSSHLWVIGFFHNADRSVLQARPRKTSTSAKPYGVFAMRAPVRPNPLGLTCARITQIENGSITVERLDFQDKTPIIDLKPYTPGWDLIPSASSSHRYDPSRYQPDELSDALLRDATNALGLAASRSPVIDALISGLRTLVIEGIDLRSDKTRFALNASQLDERVDVLMCATGASFGNRRLCVSEEHSNALVRVHSATSTLDITLVGTIERN